MATNKLLNKESLNGVFAEIKRELGNIPKSVSDLEDADDYATKEYTDAHTIENVTATVEVGGEVKQATVTKDGADVNIDFPDLQGPKGDPLTWDDLTPIQKASLKGDPGDNCYVGQGDLPLAQVVSQATDKAITPKAVQDAIGDFMEVTLTRLKNCYINTDVIESSSSGTNNCWFAPVKRGDIVKFIGTNEDSSDKTVRIGFCSIKPALQVPVSSVVSTSGTGAVILTNVSDTDGYVVINHNSEYYLDHKLFILRYAKAGEIDGKATEKSLMDVAKAALSAMGETALVESAVSSNIYTIHGDTRTKSGCKMYKYDNVEEGKIYHVKGNVPTEAYYVGYIFFDSDGVSMGYGETGNGSGGRLFDTLVECPKGATTLYVGGYDNNNVVAKGEVLELAQPTTNEQKKQVRDNLGIIDDTYMIPVDMAEEYLHSRINNDGTIQTIQSGQPGYNFVFVENTR